MTRLSLSGLTVALGGREVLHGVSVEVPDAAFAVIVGPSGCGKSTLLRTIAGLTRPTSGRIMLGDVVLSDADSFTPPERRGVGWVPQDASLFPHLTVAQNVAFARPAKRRMARADPAVDELLELTGLTGLAHRFPDELSGGQAQRVALARALRAHPAVLLLDEPFAALDPGLRSDLRDELRELLRTLSITGLLVTHDQAEALLLADTMIVMNEGRIAQTGPPQEVYRAPSSPWVGAFVGEATFLDAVADGRGLAETALGEIAVIGEWCGPVSVMLRPEQLELGEAGIDARVTRVRFGGDDALVELVTAQGQSLRVRVVASRMPAVHDTMRVSVGGVGVGYPREAGSAVLCGRS